MIKDDCVGHQQVVYGRSQHISVCGRAAMHAGENLTNFGSSSLAEVYVVESESEIHVLLDGQRTMIIESFSRRAEKQ